MKPRKKTPLPEADQGRALAVIAENLRAAALAPTLNDGTTVRGKSPWQPSVTATARVPDTLPVPDTCPCCGGKRVVCLHHDKVYGRSFSNWPWLFSCQTCAATVGLHPFTNIPLGTLATPAIRKARQRAKAAFAPLYEGGHMTRSDAYAWLAQRLGIADVGHCHIGWFGIEQCDRVVQACLEFAR